MNKKYEELRIELLWLEFDVLTASPGDNDAPFDGEDDEEQDWGQYY